MTNKKTCLLLLAVLLFPLMASADVTLSLSGPSSPVTAGSTFLVNVNVSNAVDLWAYQFDISFDQTALRILSAANGTFFPVADLLYDPPALDVTGTLPDVFNTETGLAPGMSGDGLLATLRFRALRQGDVSIVPVNAVLLNFDLAELTTTLPTALDMTVLPASPAAVPEPSSIVLFGLVVAAGALANRGRALRRR